MDLYVYDEDIELIGLTDSYASLLWIRRYKSAGSFELYTPLTAEAAELLTPRRYIYRPDVGEAMYISGVTEEGGGEDGRFLRVVGYSVDGILRKRCIMTDGTAVGILDGIKAVLDASPLGAVEYGTRELDTVTRTTERTDILEDWVRDSCVIGDRDISYRIRLLPDAKKLRIELYSGNDLSQDVVFGDEWGNVNNMQYAYSEDGCANVIICKCGAVTEDGVELEPSKGIPHYTLGSAEGLARTERLIITEPVVKDGVRTVYDADGTPSTEEYRYLSYDDTLAKMQEEAAAAYADYAESYSADALGSGYRTEWDVGDIVTVRNSLRGISYTERIEEVQETFDTGGVSVSPTFGEPLKTILDLINKR